MKKLLVIGLFCLSRYSFAQFTTTVGDITQINNGNVGIGINPPTAKLHVSGGSVLFGGGTGVVPATGGGNRMMWVGQKTALRAGSVVGNRWDDANIGTGSIALGYNNMASGLRSSAYGSSTTSSGVESMSFGKGTTASGTVSTSFGNQTVSSGNYSTSFGVETVSQSYCSFVIGRYNNNPGFYSTTTWDPTQLEPLFVIGNGSSSTLRNDAVIVRKNGYFGIGVNPSYKLHIVDNATTISSAAVYVDRIQPGAGESFGIKSSCSTASINIGIESTGIGICTSAAAYGIRAQAYNANTNYGVYASVPSDQCITSTNYAIYGTTASTPDGTKYAGYFNGNIGGTGIFSYVSDQKFKKNVLKLDNALEKILRLNPSQYSYKTGEFWDMNLPYGNHYGLIAQELIEVMPDLVSKNVFPAQYEKETGKLIHESVDYLGVNYIELIPLTIKAIQEQQKIIDELKLQIIELKESRSSELLTNSTSNLENSKLFQNKPNPFNRDSNIEFNIEDKIKNAFIYIYDLNGKQTKQYYISSRGKNSININANELAPGTYLYTLIVDDIEVGTKKMIITD